ncbi:hypothetical protein bAD24_III08230 [Burkholderia sp. AD24]|nr:hypothetical protein bAD24_III08230 [Burkholderia sp. AD24]
MPHELNQRGAREPSLRHARALAAMTVAASSLALQGCALRGAPSFEIFGAYFPFWLLSGVLGLVGALVAQRIFVSTGWARTVPYLLFVCVAIGLTVAVLFWLSATGLLL